MNQTTNFDFTSFPTEVQKYIFLIIQSLQCIIFLKIKKYKKKKFIVTKNHHPDTTTVDILLFLLPYFTHINPVFTKICSSCPAMGFSR